MKRLLAIIMAVVLLFCFAGCGGEKDKTDSSTPATENKEKVVVGYVNCEPMLYTDGSGEPAGFDYDLAVKVFEALDKDVIFKEVKSEDVYMSLNNGEIHCIFGGFVSNIEDADGVKRSDKVDFSHNYMKTWQVLIAKINNGMEKIEGLKGKRGAVQAGTAGELFAKNYQTVALDIESVATYGDCITEINVGTVKFAVVDFHAANIYCGGGDTIEIMPSLKSDTQYFAVGFKKGSELRDKFNAQLEKLDADGTISKIAQAYNMGDYVVPFLYPEQ